MDAPFGLVMLALLAVLAAPVALAVWLDYRAERRAPGDPRRPPERPTVGMRRCERCDMLLIDCGKPDCPTCGGRR